MMIVTVVEVGVEQDVVVVIAAAAAVPAPGSSHYSSNDRSSKTKTRSVRGPTKLKLSTGTLQSDNEGGWHRTGPYRQTHHRRTSQAMPTVPNRTATPMEKALLVVARSVSLSRHDSSKIRKLLVAVIAAMVVICRHCGGTAFGLKWKNVTHEKQQQHQQQPCF